MAFFFTLPAVKMQYIFFVVFFCLGNFGCNIHTVWCLPLLLFKKKKNWKLFGGASEREPISCTSHWFVSSFQQWRQHVHFFRQLFAAGDSDVLVNKFQLVDKYSTVTNSWVITKLIVVLLLMSFMNKVFERCTHSLIFEKKDSRESGIQDVRRNINLPAAD